MAKLSEDQQKVLEILGAQTHGYLIGPHATAFLIEGLVPGEVEATLSELLDKKFAAHITSEAVEIQLRHVTREEPVLDDEGEDTGETVEFQTGEIEEVEVPVLNDSGKPLVVARGWHITDEGREALKK